MLDLIILVNDSRGTIIVAAFVEITPTVDYELVTLTENELHEFALLNPQHIKKGEGV